MKHNRAGTCMTSISIQQTVLKSQMTSASIDFDTEVIINYCFMNKDKKTKWRNGS